ncbi:TetR/AcrR family transcriptional regulator, regulator of autoinduction and epiphytic fitness [Janthinobacterium sp. CG_23.3]|uniref:TetR/AcrR family transcriptional regulator n=1 Tax=unclassified Janthinobacterium TaxID=2610881 RepID=UPI00034D76C6|nr:MULTISPECIES: TetR/AcrR family transcriptional regulator [unclassified Janthinobacterium]MEC5158893.1 TetR/AcrR family transcriptional regulator of autoinduction and epiphytic fitness [Janthinobacterium sp. CG_S6]
MSSPQRLTDRKRLAIVDAAIAEFRANGFEATSMDKIAATAAVSKRTVYNHFPSKDELFSEILTRLWDNSATQPPVPYRADAPMRGQLLALMWQKMQMLTDGNFLDLARVAIAETIHSPERAQAMVAKISEKDSGISNWIGAAQQDGRLKPADVQFASHVLQGQLKTFAFWPQVTLGLPVPDAAMQRQIVETAVDMFLAYYA